MAGGGLERERRERVSERGKKKIRELKKRKERESFLRETQKMVEESVL